MVVTNLRGYFDFSYRGIKRNPVATVHREGVPLKSKFIPHNYPVCLGFEFHDVEWFRRRDAKPLALADGVELDSFMPPEHATGDTPLQTYCVDVISLSSR